MHTVRQLQGSRRLLRDAYKCHFCTNPSFRDENLAARNPHPANSVGRLAVPSHLRAVHAPRDLQRRLARPELVRPSRFASPPHAGHMIFFIPQLNYGI